MIHANNVLAHVPDLNGFVRGLRDLLKPDGVVVVEVPYVYEMITHCEFDTVYHEHLSYFSLTALDELFARNDLTIQRVERLDYSWRHTASLCGPRSRAERIRHRVAE